MLKGTRVRLAEQVETAHVTLRQGTELIVESHHTDGLGQESVTLKNEADAVVVCNLAAEKVEVVP